MSIKLSKYTINVEIAYLDGIYFRQQMAAFGIMPGTTCYRVRAHGNNFPFLSFVKSKSVSVYCCLEFNSTTTTVLHPP